MLTARSSSTSSRRQRRSTPRPNTQRQGRTTQKPKFKMAASTTWGRRSMTAVHGRVAELAVDSCARGTAIEVRPTARTCARLTPHTWSRMDASELRGATHAPLDDHQARSPVLDSRSLQRPWVGGARVPSITQRYGAVGRHLYREVFQLVSDHGSGTAQSAQRHHKTS
jgi:antitoxin (DNA-binding transcriptional repressor) of toxin-antitoxin stability system